MEFMVAPARSTRQMGRERGKVSRARRSPGSRQRGTHSARLRIETLEERRLLDAIDVPAFRLFTDSSRATQGLVGSYINQSLRAVDQIDWRGSQAVAGTRVDPALFFSSSSLGSRTAVGITGGSDDDWDNFSVQWDGVVEIVASDTRLATRSDEGSRMWIDLSGDGEFQTPQERFNNGWGNGQWATVGEVTPPLPSGVYRIRVQYEEGEGGNTVSLVANPIGAPGDFAVYTDATLATPGLTGSYVNQDLRAVDQPDWRVSQTISGTRIDPQINFASTSWGTRSLLGLTGGSDANWDYFSVQWDGVVQIFTPGMRLATMSDDGSRLWLDVNRDGEFSDGEMADNHWGQGQATTTGDPTSALSAGVYPIRIQYEEGYGGNVAKLIAAPPLMVRAVYVVPSNRTAQASAVANIQDYLPRLRQWYADQMTRWGFGPRSFTYETLSDGVTPCVHVVEVGVSDAYLREDVWGHTLESAAAAGVPVWGSGEIWLAFPESQRMNADGSISGGTALGAGSGSGNDAGVAMLGGDALFRLTRERLLDDRSYAGQVVPELGTLPLVQSVSFPWFEGTTFSSIASSIQGAGAHELGHAFGLPHDFRNDDNFHGDLMGNGLRGMRGAAYPDLYPNDDMWLSYGDALALSVNRYFRSDLTPTENTGPTLTVQTSGAVAPVQGLLQVAFQAADASGLAAATLCLDGNMVAEMPLLGPTVASTLVTANYEPGQDNHYTLRVYDQQGNHTDQAATIHVNTGFNRAPRPFIRLSDSSPAIGQSITLDASSSIDPDDSANTLVVEWDLNGDGVFDTAPSTAKTYSTNFATAGTRIITARITDPHGARAVATPLTVAVASPGTDIRIQSITLDGAASLTMTYQIAGNRPDPFQFGFYRSTDAAWGTGDALLGSVPIAAPEDLAEGVHTKSLTIGSRAGQIALPGAGATETDFDYFLLAVADDQNAVDESGVAAGESNNTLILSGIYHAPGGPVIVHGTSAADAIKVLPATGGMKLDVNGTTFTYAGSDVSGVRARGHVGNDQLEFTWGAGLGTAGGSTFNAIFIGGAGSNTANLRGSTSATLFDTATVKPTYTTLASQGYSILAKDLHGVTVQGQGGPDRAYLYDSTTDDLFEAHPTYATLDYGTHTNRVQDFPFVYAYSNWQGADAAQFVAGIGNGLDQFSASPLYAVMTGPTGTGKNYYVRAENFRMIAGQSVDSESDVATLFDAAQTTSSTEYTFQLNAQDRYGLIEGGPGLVQASHFRTTVTGSRDQGADTARLYGSSGADTVQFKMYAKEVWLVPTTGSAFKYRASQVQRVEAYSATGQSDTAEFYDSPESDAFAGSPINSQMTTPSGLFASAADFRYINAFSTHTGADTATLTGKAGVQDTFVAQPTQATLGDASSGTGTTYFVWMKGFESVAAQGQGADGGRNDTAKLYGTPGHEDFLSDFYLQNGSTQRDPNRPYAIFSGTGFANTASGFAFATAYGDANDAAQLYSAATTDVFIGSPVTSVMNRSGVFYHEAKGFGEVHGHGLGAAVSGSKAKLNDATTRQVLLELNGTWVKLTNRGGTPFAVWAEDFGDVTASALGSLTQQKKKLADHVFALHTSGAWIDV